MMLLRRNFSEFNIVTSILILSRNSFSKNLLVIFQRKTTCNSNFYGSCLDNDLQFFTLTRYVSRTCCGTLQTFMQQFRYSVRSARNYESKVKRCENKSTEKRRYILIVCKSSRGLNSLLSPCSSEMLLRSHKVSQETMLSGSEWISLRLVSEEHQWSFL